MTPIKDPRLILQSEEPTIVLCNQANSFVGWLIDTRTQIPGLFSLDHAMLSKDQGRFVRQDFTGYHDIPMEDYMIYGSRLYFVTLVNSNPEFIEAFNASVEARLAAKWYEKGYDFLGIFGQIIGQNWIHTPGLRYCSVDVIRHLVNACPKLPKADQLIINNIPPQSNPEFLGEVIVTNPAVFNVKYFYDFEIAKNLL